MKLAMQKNFLRKGQLVTKQYNKNSYLHSKKNFLISHIHKINSRWTKRYDFLTFRRNDKFLKTLKELDLNMLKLSLRKTKRKTKENKKKNKEKQKDKPQSE